MEEVGVGVGVGRRLFPPLTFPLLPFLPFPSHLLLLSNSLYFLNLKYLFDDFLK